MFRYNFAPKRASNHYRFFFISCFLLVSSSLLFLCADPALAHHPFGGETPANFWQGFLSGIGHPIIGIDHFAFVIAVGLLAEIQKRGCWIPSAFVLASVVGTLLHLAALNLPAPEFFVSASVLAIGIMLAVDNSSNAVLAVLLAAVAGIFHGYAYGEAVVGAEMSPIIAYLIGFAFIQMLVAFVAYQVAKLTVKETQESATLSLRSAGFVLCGVGITLLSGLFLG